MWRTYLLILLSLALDSCAKPELDTSPSRYKLAVEGVELLTTVPARALASGSIPIRIEVKNCSPKPISLRSRAGNISFVIRVYDSMGAEVSGRAGSPMYLRENLLHGLTDEFTPPIAPGKTFVQTHDLRRLYVLENPGSYKIAISSRASVGEHSVLLEILDMPLTIIPSQ